MIADQHDTWCIFFETDRCPTVAFALRGLGEEELEHYKFTQPDRIAWEPHPQLKAVDVAPLLSNRDDQMELSIMLVRLPAGTVVEKHTHLCDDIAYVIKGRGKIWIDGVGDLPMTEGSFVRVPKGVLHFVHDVEEELLIYDVFYPFLV